METEPTWVQTAIRNLEARGYTVTCKYDIDGSSWENKLYTVTKGEVTYALDVRAQLLLRI